MVHKFGYDSLGSRHKFAAKKGLVFAYWDTPIRKQKYKELPERFQSPVIFQWVTLNLIPGTSILLLIFLSKGLFSSIGLIWLPISFDRKISSLYRAKLFFHQGDASGQSCWSLLGAGRCSSEYRESYPVSAQGNHSIHLSDGIDHGRSMANQDAESCCPEGY